MPDYNFKPKMGRKDFGWHYRNLPHLDSDGYAQFVTFRLYDSMPQSILDKWRSETEDDAEFRKRVEAYLDAGAGECFLRNRKVATLVQEALLFHNGSKYDLHALVVMPNHGHILLSQSRGEHLPQIMHSIKSYTANAANKVLGRKGLFWQHEYFDRYIRDQRHFSSVVKYIENNPVTAGLCESPADWEFGSAYVRLRVANK